MSTETQPTRREFLGKTAAAATVTSVAATGLTVAQSANVAGSDRIKVGLIGSGGRGSGAANQALSTKQEGVVLHAICDAFKEKADGALSNLRTKHADKVQVDDSRIFTGLDGYQGVIDSCDLVILTTPPGFRPYHFEAAINAGKHVFMEKPVAVDSPGVRKVLEMAKVADEKNLKVVVGLQRHYQNVYLEAFKKVHEEKLIGDVRGGQAWWNGRRPWIVAREPGWTEMEYQMRNWYHFNWLCGDHIVEQHVQREPPGLRPFEPGATVEPLLACDQGEPGGIYCSNARSGRPIGALSPGLDRAQQPAGAKAAKQESRQRAQQSPPGRKARDHINLLPGARDIRSSERDDLASKNQWRAGALLLAHQHYGQGISK